MNDSSYSLSVNTNNITPFDYFVNHRSHTRTEPYSGVYSSIVYTVDNIVVDCIVVVKNSIVVVELVVVVDLTLVVVHTVRLLLILCTVY